MDRLLQMIFRRVLGRLVSRGVDAGINRATRGRQDRDGAGQPRHSDNARTAARLGRRFTRF